MKTNTRRVNLLLGLLVCLLLEVVSEMEKVSATPVQIYLNCILMHF